MAWRVLTMALAVLLLPLVNGIAAKGVVGEGQGPVFLHEPPPRLHFSNTTGALLPCSAHGSPPPAVQWLVGGRVAVDVPDVRVVHKNGSLQFLPFPPYAYTAAVHAATYACRASSTQGTILSTPVHVRAVVRQYYEVQVYDEFVISGNTAVIKCHVPSFVRDYVTVTSWVRGNGERIVSDVLTGGRYSVFGSGELHIRHVTKADEFQSYHCETQHVLTKETTISAVAGRLMVSEPRSSVPPRITDSRSSVTSSLRHTVELPCAAQGFPIPNYQWHRVIGKVEVPVVEDGRIQQVGGSLLIRQVQASDAARYVCVVSSNVGSERAHTSLEVWAPLTAHITPQVQTVDVGVRATFNCSPEGFPQDEISWLKDGKPLDDSERVQLVSRRTLLVEEVRREDRGMYQCFVSNLEGAAQGSAQLKLGDAAPQLLDVSGPQVVSPGARVTLRCQVEGSPPPSISWEVRGLPAATSDPRVTVEHTVEAERVLSRLSISSVKVEDGGVWACVGSNRAGRVEHTERLNVRGPPTIRPMAPVSVVAGREARFDCVVAGFPIDSIYWEKNGVVLPVSERQEVLANGTLVVAKVSREADGGQYTCVAAAGDNTARAHLKVNVMVPPKIDERIISLGSGFPAKSRARILCVVTRGDLPLSFTWTHKGHPISSTSHASIKYLDEVSSVLLFPSLREEDGGSYTCTATNAVAADAQTVTLVVQVAPSWKEEPQDASAVVGADFVLPCAAHGSPQPTVTWRRAEGDVPRQYLPVTTLGDNVRVTQNHSLVVMGVRRHQGGEFLCSASNGVGSDLSKSVSVIVKAPPNFDESEVNVTVTAGRSARVVCEAFGDLPIEVTWAHNIPPVSISGEKKNAGMTIEDIVLNGSLSSLSSSSSSSSYSSSSSSYSSSFISSSQSSSISSSLPSPSSPPSSSSTVKRGREGTGFRSVLTMQTKSRHDSKVLWCFASNVYGNDTKKIYLVVQEIPGTPGNPRVTGRGSRSMNLTWSPPRHDGNSPVTLYRVLIINSSESWLNVGRIRAVEASVPNAQISGLAPAHTYLVRVVAVNGVGTSQPSQEVRMSTVQEPPSKAPTNVRVTSLSSSSLRVTWQPPESPRTRGKSALGYYVGYKVTNSSEPFRYHTLNAESVVAYRPEVILKNLHKFKSYMITVQAFSAAGAGPRTSPLTATTQEDVPSEPPGQTQCSSLSSTSLLLRWSPPPSSAINGNLQGYKITYRAVQSNRLFDPGDLKVQTVSTVSSRLLGLDCFTNYSITVAAFTRRGDGVNSPPIHCTTDEDVPGPVDKIKALAVDSQSVLIVWQPPAKPNGVITKYTVKLHHPDNYHHLKHMVRTYAQGIVGMHKSGTTNGALSSEVDRSEDGSPMWVLSGKERQHLVANLAPATSFGFSVHASTRVGDCPAGMRVTQRPRSDAPAAISSFSDEMVAVWGEQLRLACRMVGYPTPTRVWAFNGQVVPHIHGRLQQYPDGSLLVADVKARDGGNYTCTASNQHGSDTINYIVTVQVPPAPPLVYVSDVTSSTLTVRWRAADSPGTPILGYHLHEKREFGDWHRVDVPEEADSYTLTGLQCGTRYQVYVTAFNHVGVSQPSEAIPTKTQGMEPIVPAQSSLLRVNVTHISLNLAAWLDGGCPITSLVVEYKERDTSAWILVSNHVKWDNTSEFLVLDLTPANHYTLRVTAHNSAGSSIAIYHFTTLTQYGNALSHELMTHGFSNVMPWYLDANTMVAVVSVCILVLLALCVAVAYSCRRTHNNSHTDKAEAYHLRHDNASPDSCQTSEGVMGGRNLEILEAYPPSTLPLGSYDEISPYATFRMNGENTTPPPPPLPSRLELPATLKSSLPQPDVSLTDSTYASVKSKCPATQDGGGVQIPSRTDLCEKTEKATKGIKGKAAAVRTQNIAEKEMAGKEASGSSVTSVSSNHEELVRAYKAHSQTNGGPTTPESGRRNKYGTTCIVTSSEVTTESDTPGGPVCFHSSLADNNKALRVPALFKKDGDYQIVADVVGGGRSRTESITSHESADEARNSSSYRRSRGQEMQARQGHRPSRGEPDYSYARPVKKQCPPPPPFSSTESNSAEYSEGSLTSYSRRNTLEFSEAECDHPSSKKGMEPLAQLLMDMELEKMIDDASKAPV